jgi:hypothetical protein
MKQLLLALLAGAVVGRAAVAELQLEEFSSAWIEAGSVISVAQRPIMRAVVRVSDPYKLLRGSLRVSVCDLPSTAFLTETSRIGDFEIIHATASDRFGFSGEKEPCQIKVTSVRREVEFNMSDWKVVRWSLAYLQAVTVKPGVPGPSVRLDEPAKGSFGKADKGRMVVVKGAVVDNGDFPEVLKGGGFRASIDGSKMERDFTRGGWAFTGEVRLESGAKDVEILVISPLGSYTRLLVPVMP